MRNLFRSLGMSVFDCCLQALTLTNIRKFSIMLFSLTQCNHLHWCRHKHTENYGGYKLERHRTSRSCLKRIASAPGLSYSEGTEKSMYNLACPSHLETVTNMEANDAFRGMARWCLDAQRVFPTALSHKKKKQTTTKAEHKDT